MYQDTSVSAFGDNTYQYLGKKTFWFLLSQKSAASFGFLIVALGISIGRVHVSVPADIAGYLQIASRISFGLFILSGLFAFFAARFTYKSTAFMLGEDALTLKRGVMTTEEYAIPYRQIQNIEIERSFSQRMAGISKIIILTAAEDEDKSNKDEGVLPAIDKDVAESLKAELLRRASIQKVIQA